MIKKSSFQNAYLQRIFQLKKNTQFLKKIIILTLNSETLPSRLNYLRSLSFRINPSISNYSTFLWLWNLSRGILPCPELRKLQTNVHAHCVSLETHEFSKHTPRVLMYTRVTFIHALVLHFPFLFLSLAFPSITLVAR